MNLPDNVIGALLAWGPGGVVVLLFLFGVIIPRGQYMVAVGNAAAWQAAYEKERDAHQLTREALAKAEERGDAATQLARTANNMLDALGHPARGGSP